MTYAELGRVRGISTASATRLAFRRKWQRQRGNDGTARVAVPVSEARRQIERAHDDRDGGVMSPALSARWRQRSPLLASAPQQMLQPLRLLREQLTAAEQGRDAERSRADALRDKIEGLQAQVATAEAEAETARTAAREATQTAATLRKAEGTVQTLGDHAAWAKAGSALAIRSNRCPNPAPSVPL
jgi:hypothetical protein